MKNQGMKSALKKTEGLRESANSSLPCGIRTGCALRSRRGGQGGLGVVDEVPVLSEANDPGAVPRSHRGEGHAAPAVAEGAGRGAGPVLIFRGPGAKLEMGPSKL